MVTGEEIEEDLGQFNDEDYEGVIFPQKDFICNLQEKELILSSWILLDSQSTVDVFCSLEMLQDKREVKQDLVMHCNAGMMSVTKKGDLKGHGTIWHHLTGIANILSLDNFCKN